MTCKTGRPINEEKHGGVLDNPIGIDGKTHCKIPKPPKLKSLYNAGAGREICSGKSWDKWDDIFYTDKRKAIGNGGYQYEQIEGAE